MGDGLFSPWHIVIVALLAVVLFYRGDKLPDMARSVGRSLRVFKTEIKGLTEDDKAREAAKTDSAAASGDRVNVTKELEAPASSAGVNAPHVVAAPSEPIPVQAEVVRAPDVRDPDVREPGARPRPRPAGSAPRR